MLRFGINKNSSSKEGILHPVHAGLITCTDWYLPLVLASCACPGTFHLPWYLPIVLASSAIPGNLHLSWHLPLVLTTSAYPDNLHHSPLLVCHCFKRNGPRWLSSPLLDKVVSYDSVSFFISACLRACCLTWAGVLNVVWSYQCSNLSRYPSPRPPSCCHCF